MMDTREEVVTPVTNVVVVHLLPSQEVLTLTLGLEETVVQEPQDGELPIDGETKRGEVEDTAEQDYLELAEEVLLFVVTATTTKLDLTVHLPEMVKEELFGILMASSSAVAEAAEALQQHGVVLDRMPLQVTVDQELAEVPQQAITPAITENVSQVTVEF